MTLSYTDIITNFWLILTFPQDTTKYHPGVVVNETAVPKTQISSYLLWME